MVLPLRWRYGDDGDSHGVRINRATIVGCGVCAVPPKVWGVCVGNFPVVLRLRSQRRRMVFVVRFGGTHRLDAHWDEACVFCPREPVIE